MSSPVATVAALRERATPVVILNWPHELSIVESIRCVICTSVYTKTREKFLEIHIAVCITPSKSRHRATICVRSGRRPRNSLGE